MANKEKITKILMGVRAVLIVAVAICTIIAVLIITQRKRDARPFNHYEFRSTLVVDNATDYERADTISLYLAKHVFNIDTLNLIIVYIPEHINEGEMEYFGVVQHLPFKKNQFIILLNRDEMSLSKLKETLSHEFIHIDQYIRGDLVMYPLYAIWKGEDVYFGEIEYKDRPFEEEAFKYQAGVMSKLNKVLYK